MRRLLLAIPGVLLFSACFETATVETVPFDTQRPAFDFPAGQTRLMIRTFGYETPIEKKTNYDLGWFRVEKDSLFQGMPAKVVESRFWTPYTDTVIRYRQRELYVFEDSQVSVYTFKADQSVKPFLVGLFKTSAADTNTFSDRLVQMKYPLIQNRPWSIRPAIDSFPNVMDLPKEYTGLDTLEFGGRNYVCGKLVMHGVSGIPIKTWISRLGLLKAESSPQPFTVIDSLDVIIGTGYVHESYSLLDLDVDSTAAAGYFEKYGNGPYPRITRVP